MIDNARILVVDDRPVNVKALRIRLSSVGYEVLEATNGPDALSLVEQEHPDLVLLDVMMPGMDGFEVCRRIKAKQDPDFLPVILVTARTETESIVKGLDLGADEYVTKPFDAMELMARIKSMLRIRRMYQENTHLKREIQATYRFDNLIGESPAMERVYNLVEKVIESTITVLLTGETGTGKEAIARAIHYSGPRKDHRFVCTNCGALAENLLESELFGHKKGAYTGAHEDRIGLFEAASNGTIFLDEIGETSPAMQVKLLRVLQESEVTRVGETEPRKVDIRIIAATNRDLEAKIQSGTFREDLYYRISVFPIALPPLKDRRTDIPLLAHHFLKKHTHEKAPAGFTPEALDALARYDWPGNVRELDNEIERALLLSTNGSPISRNELSEKIRGLPDRNWRKDGSLKDAVEAVECEMIQAAFEQYKGNRTRMAKQLGITRWTLLQKMKAFGIE
ncbi:MAG: sigma-54 dependent transcriptional regulator [bacterium]|nr:sigma-54 dependent transcriptional regulator [bacterium]